MAFINKIVDIVQVMYCVSYFFQLPIVGQYVYSRISAKYGLPYAYASSNSSCDTGQLNATQMLMQQKIQSEAAQFQVSLQFSQNIPSIIVMLFFGSVSDRIGRKPFIVWTTFATTVYATVTACVIKFQLPLYFIYIGAFFDGLGGSFTAMCSVSVTYIVDITKRERLVGRLGILEGLVLLAMMLVFYSSGLIISHYDFALPQIFIAGVFATDCLWAVVVLRESKDKTSSVSLRELLQVVANGWHVLTKKRRQRSRLYLALAAESFNTALNLIPVSILLLYLYAHPMCFTSDDTGKYLGTMMMVQGLGVIAATKLISRCVRRETISMFSYFMTAVSFYMMSMVTNKTLAYVALIPRIFCLAAAPSLKAIISQTVEPSEIGTIYWVSASVEQALNVLMAILCNFLYILISAKTGDPKTFFYFPTLVTLIPLLFAVVLMFKSPDGSNEENKAILENKAQVPIRKRKISVFTDRKFRNQKKYSAISRNVAIFVR